jgi:hypothetical protein
MSYKPRTYKEYRDGLTEGQTITVDENVVNVDYGIPLLGKYVLNYGQHINQSALNLAENFTVVTGFPGNTDILPEGSIVYNNTSKTLSIRHSGGNYYTLVTSPTDFETINGVRPIAPDLLKLGSEDRRWDELHVSKLHNIQTYLRDGNELKTLESAFIQNSDDITHDGIEINGETVTSALDSALNGVEVPVSITYIDSVTEYIAATHNAVYVNSSGAGQTVLLSDTALDGNVCIFSALASITSPITVTLTITGQLFNINNVAFSTSVTIVGGATIIRENNGGIISWLVTGSAS